MKIVYIITGSSRGLGESLSNLICLDHDVMSINRRDVSARTNVINHVIDLSDVKSVETRLQELQLDCDIVVFISNAAILDPIKTICNSSLKEIEKAVCVNYLSPILILKSLLVKNKKVLAVNITSGAKNTINKGLSIYSSLKSAFYHLLEISFYNMSFRSLINYCFFGNNYS